MPELMSTQRWRQVDEIFSAALALPAPEIPAFLALACGPDEVLRAQVDSLLADCGAGADLETGGGLAPEVLRELAADVASRELLPPGTAVGPYRVVRELGRGGMAIVYLADRIEGGFEQRVALKLIKRGLETEQILRRFLTERQILSSLEHPHIARLLDGGVTDDGRPFFTMEWVDGEPIDQYTDRHELSLRSRLRLLVDLGRAVSAAHRALVVHRDIKPSNILVTPDGIPKLLDFGIAKLLGPVSDQRTRTRHRLLTPEYASPEQLEGGPVTTATDVFQLGAVLYRLLTGLHLERFANAGTAESSTRSVPQEIKKPSTVATTPFKRRLAGDLDNIVGKALRDDSADRYATADGLVDDLERFLDGRPVQARTPRLGYRLRKLVGRHRLATVAALALVASSAFYTVWLVQERARASAAAKRAEQTALALEGLFGDFDPYAARGGQVTVGDLLDRARTRVDRDLGDQPEVQARLRVLLGRLYNKLGRHEDAAAVAEEAVAQRRQLHGPDHLSVAQAAVVQGTAQVGLGRFRVARATLEEAVGVLEAASPPPVDDLTQGLSRLSRLAWSYRENERALELSARALDLQERTYGAADPRVAALLQDRAEVLVAVGDPAVAVPLLKRAVGLWREADGDESARVGQALFLMARALARGAAPAEAVPVFEQALATTEAVLGRDHGSIGDMKVELGALLGRLDRRTEALVLLREGLGIHQAAHGDSSPAALRSREKLGGELLANGHFDKARALFAEQLAQLEVLMGQESRHLYGTITRLAEATVAAGDPLAALALWQRALTLITGQGEALAEEVDRTQRAIAALQIQIGGAHNAGIDPRQATGE